MKYYEITGDWKMMIVAANSELEALKVARKWHEPATGEQYECTELRQPGEPEVVAYYFE